MFSNFYQLDFHNETYVEKNLRWRINKKWIKNQTNVDTVIITLFDLGVEVPF